jgi:hypothetical protein
MGILEVMVAFFILTGVVAATSYLLVSELSGVASLKSRVTAASLATQVSNCIHASSTSWLFSPVVLGSTVQGSTSQTISSSKILNKCNLGDNQSDNQSDSNYIETTNVNLSEYSDGSQVSEPSFTTSCFGFTEDPQILLNAETKIENSELAKNNNSVDLANGFRSTTQSTLLIPPQIDVSVSNGSTSLSGVSVFISNTNGVSYSGYTNDQGCISFVGLPVPAQYTVSVNFSKTVTLSKTEDLSPAQVLGVSFVVPGAPPNGQGPGGPPVLDTIQAVPWMQSPSTSEAYGPEAGGNTVILCGSNFYGSSNQPPEVLFSYNGIPASGNVSVVTSATDCSGYPDELKVIVPPSPEPNGATVSVSVFTSSDSNSLSYQYQTNPYVYELVVTNPSTGQPNYQTPAGTPFGGTQVMIEGFNLADATAVNFGLYPNSSSGPFWVSAGFKVFSDSEIIAQSPVDWTNCGFSSSDITAFDFCTGLGLVEGNATNYAAVQVVEKTSVTVTVNGNPNTQTETESSSTSSPDCPLESPISLNGTNVDCHFLYAFPPKLTQLAPSGGPVAGGTTVDICGGGFLTSGPGEIVSVNFGTYVMNQSQFQIITQPYSLSKGLVNKTPCGNINAIYPSSVTYIQVTSSPPALQAGVTGPNGGTAMVSVSAADGLTSNALPFLYAYPPSISSISPTGGPVGGGNTVTIYGSHLGHVTSVNFGCYAVSSFSSQSSNQIVLTAPAAHYKNLVLGCTSFDNGPEQVTVTATNAVGTSNGVSYTYANTPSISSLNPGNGPASGGNTIAICGSNLQYITSAHFGRSKTNVSEQSWGANLLNGGPCSGAPTGGYNYLQVVVPPSPSGGYDQVGVTITNAAGMTSNSLTYTYNPPPPSISSISQHGGNENGGYTIYIYGSNLDGPGFNTTVNFGCPGNGSINWGNSSELSVQVPDTSSWTGMCGNYWGDTHPFQTTITVSTIGGSTSWSPWTYQDGPSISSLSPSSGNANGGNQVCINGSNLEYATYVVFNGNWINVRYNGNNSQVCVTAPSNYGNGGQVSVWVQMPSGVGSSNSLTYTYEGPPSISSINPTSQSFCAPGDISFSIYGSNFTGATSVTVGGSSVSYSVANSGQINVYSWEWGSMGGQVAVTTSVGTAYGPSFNYSSPWYC